MVIRKCVVCGKEFTVDSPRQITCTEECNTIRKKEQRKARREKQKEADRNESKLRIQKVRIAALLRNPDLQGGGIHFSGSRNKNMLYAISGEEIGIVTAEQGFLRLSKIEAARMIRELEKIVAGMEDGPNGGI